MKILINGKFLGAPRTGVQRVAFELVRALDRLKAQKDPAFDKQDFEVAFPKGYDVNLELKATPLSSTMKLPGVLWEQVYLAWTSRRVRLLNICNAGPVLATNAVTVIHDAQVYITPQSYSKAFRIWYKLILPLMGRRHRAIVTVSEFSKAELVKNKVAPAHKISVVHNGVDHILAESVDHRAFEKLKIPSRSYILALSNTQAHKNITILIDAFRDPRLAGLSLVLFGKAGHDEFIKCAPLPQNIRFVGKVSDAELRGLLECALCLGFPSTTEGFGLPALEAMLLGCPVVAAPCGALPEVCEKAVLYADPGKPNEWVDAFLTLSMSNDLWAEMAEKGRNQAQAFTWERAAKKLNAVLSLN